MLYFSHRSHVKSKVKMAPTFIAVSTPSRMRPDVPSQVQPVWRAQHHGWPSAFGFSVSSAGKLYQRARTYTTAHLTGPLDPFQCRSESDGRPTIWSSRWDQGGAWSTKIGRGCVSCSMHVATDKGGGETSVRRCTSSRRLGATTATLPHNRSDWSNPDGGHVRCSWCPVPRDWYALSPEGENDDAVGN